MHHTNRRVYSSVDAAWDSDLYSEGGQYNRPLNCILRTTGVFYNISTDIMNKVQIGVGSILV